MITKGFSANVHDHHFYPARVLYGFAARGDVEPLMRHARAFAGQAPALSQLPRDLAQLATYDPDLRSALSAVWPRLLNSLLDEIEDGADPLGDRYFSEDALAHMVPGPQLEMGDRSPDATLAVALAQWIDPELLAEQVERWMPLARGRPRCVDAVVNLARTASPAWQGTVGIRWVSQLIDGRYDRVASHCWFLPEWLREVRASGHLDSDGLRTVQRIVDGLATHGDHRAVRLQRADE